MHRVIIVKRGYCGLQYPLKKACLPVNGFSPLLSFDHRQKRDRRRCNYQRTQNEYFSLTHPPPPTTRAICQWARSLDWRHTMMLHILVRKICFSFFPFSCEACSLYLVIWLWFNGFMVELELCVYIKAFINILLSWKLFYTQVSLDPVN